MVPDDLTHMELSMRGDDWAPTPHGRFLGEVLARHADLVRDKEALELGGGVGNHTIRIIRQGAKRVVTTEVTAERLATTRANVEHNCPGNGVAEFRIADWTATDGPFDVVVSNPPFARSGKRNRRYFLETLILDAHKLLRPEGELVFVQSSMANLARTRRDMERNGFEFAVVEETEGPFRDYYFEDPSFMEEIQGVENGFEIRGGQHYERLYVVKGTLLPWSPPAGSH